MRGWPEHACIGCSMVADQVAHPAHRSARDTTLVFVFALASQKNVEGLKARMGWSSSPGTRSRTSSTRISAWMSGMARMRLSATATAFRTYFINNRGDEQMGSTWNYLDITALGRQEKWEDSPEGLSPDRAVRLVDLARRIRRGQTVSKMTIGAMESREKMTKGENHQNE